MNNNTNRLHLIDALRGFAIVSIMLLHNIEHFDFYYTPTNLPLWMQSLDRIIWDTLFFIFGGKSYAIFALLFGLTFFIQNDNQEKKGIDFRPRFAWRLVLLLAFGIINSTFYQGDILTIYAIVGFGLIPVAKPNTKTVFWIAVLLMFQPYEWIMVLHGIQNPQLTLPDPLSWSYFGKMGEYITGNSLIDTWIGNITNGRISVLLWNWENARVFQTLSLFLFGMLAGRTSLFIITEKRKLWWKKAFFVAALCFIPLFIIKTKLGSWIEMESIRRPLTTIETSWTNMAFMMVLVSGFVLLFHSKLFNRFLSVFSPIGRMSLSNYIIQSIIGSFIYYGYGLALYQYTGTTHCLMIGIALAILQGIFSRWWMKNNPQGPLETIWHRLTWIGAKK